jgi:hypothetical protein
MTNKVKYAQSRKYRDVGFSEPPKSEPRIRPKRPIILKRKLGLFEKIKKVIKSIFKK